VAEIPSEGICRNVDDRPCLVKFNFHRTRETGPCFPLAVLRCTTHNRSFTVYPAGFGPYWRYALVAVSPSGESTISEEQTLSHKRDDLFTGTTMQAALDAAVGRPWKRENDGLTERWWPSQTRTLSKLLRLFGVDLSLTSAAREQIAAALDVDHLFLNECARLIERGPGYRSRGSAVRKVLDRMILGPCILDRLLHSGYLAGLWGLPLRWKASPGVMRSPPFPKGKSRSPPG